MGGLACECQVRDERRAAGDGAADAGGEADHGAGAVAQRGDAVQRAVQAGPVVGAERATQRERRVQLGPGERVGGEGDVAGGEAGERHTAQVQNKLQQRAAGEQGRVQRGAQRRGQQAKEDLLEEWEGGERAWREAGVNGGAKSWRVRICRKRTSSSGSHGSAAGGAAGASSEAEGAEEEEEHGLGRGPRRGGPRSGLEGWYARMAAQWLCAQASSSARWTAAQRRACGAAERLRNVPADRTPGRSAAVPNNHASTSRVEPPAPSSAPAPRPRPPWEATTATAGRTRPPSTRAASGRPPARRLSRCPRARRRPALAESWPAGGWFPDPRGWRRNTALAGLGMLAASYVVLSYSARLEARADGEDGQTERRGAACVGGLRLRRAHTRFCVGAATAACAPHPVAAVVQQLRAQEGGGGGVAPPERPLLLPLFCDSATGWLSGARRQPVFGPRGRHLLGRRTVAVDGGCCLSCALLRRIAVLGPVKARAAA